MRSVTLKMRQIRFPLGLRPGPAGKAYDAPPDSRDPSRLGRPIPRPLTSTASLLWPSPLNSSADYEFT